LSKLVFPQDTTWWKQRNVLLSFFPRILLWYIKMRLIHLAQPLASIWGASRSTKHEPILPSWICRRVVSRFVTRRSSNFDGWIFRRCMLISSAETFLLNPFIGWIFRRCMLNVFRKKRRRICLYSSYFKRALKMFQNQIICLFNQISNIFFFLSCIPGH